MRTTITSVLKDLPDERSVVQKDLYTDDSLNRKIRHGDKSSKKRQGSHGNQVILTKSFRAFFYDVLCLFMHFMMIANGPCCRTRKRLASLRCKSGVITAREDRFVQTVFISVCSVFSVCTVFSGQKKQPPTEKSRVKH